MGEGQEGAGIRPRTEFVDGADRLAADDPFGDRAVGERTADIPVVGKFGRVRAGKGLGVFLGQGGNPGAEARHVRRIPFLHRLQPLPQFASPPGSPGSVRRRVVARPGVTERE